MTDEPEPRSARTYVGVLLVQVLVLLALWALGRHFAS
jgi:hypothetical protein